MLQLYKKLPLLLQVFAPLLLLIILESIATILMYSFVGHDKSGFAGAFGILIFPFFLVVDFITLIISIVACLILGIKKKNTLAIIVAALLILVLGATVWQASMRHQQMRSSGIQRQSDFEPLT